MHSEEDLQKAINRRDFIAGTTTGVLGILTMGAAEPTQGQQSPAPQQPRRRRRGQSFLQRHFGRDRADARVS